MSDPFRNLPSDVCKGGTLSDWKKISLIVAGWVVLVSGLHLALNTNWKVLLNDRLPPDERKLNVGYIPVT